MRFLKERTRREIIGIWLLLIIGSFYLFFFQGEFIAAQVVKIKILPLFWLCVIYLLLGCLRGFTLIPVTYLILLGLIFLPPLPAYILTIIGVMISSAIIYYFSEYLSLADYFRKNHAGAIAKITSILRKNELPIVISWSFLPFAPTDVLCYVCGMLEVDVKKFLLGIFIGEATSCAIYMFLGRDILLFITHRVLGL